MIIRYLAIIAAVLRIIPAPAFCSFGAVVIAFTAIAVPGISPLGSVLVIYGSYRSIRRYRALNYWQAYEL
jgi:hypothetical protein